MKLPVRAGVLGSLCPLTLRMHEVLLGEGLFQRLWPLEAEHLLALVIRKEALSAWCGLTEGAKVWGQRSLLAL